MQQAEIKLTSELLWNAALVTALIDVVVVSLLAWRVSWKHLSRAKWTIVAVAAVVFAGLWAALASGYYWEECYRHVFPAWSRWLLPFYMGTLFGAGALLCRWLALRMPGNPVANFCFLGGLTSLPGHAWGIYGRDMLEKCAMLRGVSPAAALAFGVFEFIFYWGAILAIAVLLYAAGQRWSGRPRF